MELYYDRDKERKKFIIERLIYKQRPDIPECDINLEKAKIILIDSLIYVDSGDNFNYFKGFPKWLFGVFLKKEPNALLYSYLSVHPVYGYFILGEYDNYIPCFIINRNKEFELENTYILLKKYTLFTEVFSKGYINNIGYLVFDQRDVFVVYSSKIRNILFDVLPPEKHDIALKKQMQFTVLMISSVCLDTEGLPEVYLKVLINTSRKYMILSSPHVKKSSYLKEGYRYILYYNNELQYYDHLDLNHLEKLESLILNDENAFFQELGIHDNTVEINRILDTSEAYSILKNQNQLISFHGIVFSRTIPWKKSKTLSKKKYVGFGMPDDDIHILTFTEKEKSMRLQMHLFSDFDQILPLGLIPNMRVIVRNVWTYQNYVQATKFTTVEIIEYAPMVPFQTAKMLKNHEVDWGPSSFLSFGNMIPQGPRVWAQIINFYVLEIKFSSKCKRCSKQLESTDLCVRCQINERINEFKLIMTVEDQFGKTKIIVKDINILQLILDVSDKTFDAWLSGFLKAGQYMFTIFEKERKYYKLDSNSNTLKNCLTQYILSFNMKSCNLYDMKCCKLPIDATLKSPPIWFYLDARKSFDCREFL